MSRQRKAHLFKGWVNSARGFKLRHWSTWCGMNLDGPRSSLDHTTCLRCLELKRAHSIRTAELAMDMATTIRVRLASLRAAVLLLVLLVLPGCRATMEGLADLAQWQADLGGAVAEAAGHPEPVWGGPVLPGPIPSHAWVTIDGRTWLLVVR